MTLLRSVLMFVFLGVLSVSLDLLNWDVGEASSQEVSRDRVYVVKRGDRLWKIADHIYGNPFLWKKLYRDNQRHIQSPHRIYPGQTLKVLY